MKRPLFFITPIFIVALGALSTACVEVVDPDVGQELALVEQAREVPTFCEDYFYQTCTADEHCPDGYGCGPLNDGCTSSVCGCDPTTGDIFCTADCGLDLGLCEPRGGEGDPCGVWLLPDCASGLHCLGGFPPADQPGTCLVAPRCRRVRLNARCEDGLAVIGGRTHRRFAGQLMMLDVNGFELPVRVRRNGTFFVHTFVDESELDVAVVGCDDRGVVTTCAVTGR